MFRGSNGMQKNDLFRNDGKTALVTGAGTGIGRASAIALANSGVTTLFLNGRRRNYLEETASLIAELAPTCHIICVEGDLTSPTFRKKLTEQILSSGTLDILINNAGVYHTTKFDEISDAELMHVWQTNVESVFALTRDLLPALDRSKSPSVINIGSTLSLRPIAQGAGYNISKAAIDHLTRSLALELGPRRIRVNCISPGIVETPMYRGRFSSDDAYLDAINEARVWHPLGRVGRPDDIANAVVFLSSPASEWITGVVLPVDGGLLTS
jgi:NAD(P)-dependent dehydrogenase (short-subunit alcohol dehydrogenase family)